MILTRFVFCAMCVVSPVWVASAWATNNGLNKGLTICKLLIDISLVPNNAYDMSCVGLIWYHKSIYRFAVLNKLSQFPPQSQMGCYLWIFAIGHISDCGTMLGQIIGLMRYVSILANLIKIRNWKTRLEDLFLFTNAVDLLNFNKNAVPKNEMLFYQEKVLNPV